MSVPASLHDLFFSCVLNSDCFGFILFLYFFHELLYICMSLIEFACVCVCV